LAQKVTRQKGLKKSFLEWIKNLSEQEFTFFWPNSPKETILSVWGREKKEVIADQIGLMSYKYLTEWPSEEEKYEKAAQLLSLIPKNRAPSLIVIAFQNLRSCLGWFSGFDPEKLESALKRYGL